MVLLHILFFTLCLNRAKRQLLFLKGATHSGMQLTNLKCLNCVQAAALGVCLHLRFSSGQGGAFDTNLPLTPTPTRAAS